MAVGGNRRWITRDEIAEIHEARARNLACKYYNAPPEERAAAVVRIQSAGDSAKALRAAEKLGNKIGCRTA